MKKNKGFTLIELLAVIVILAIIALIATPIILDVIDKAKQGAKESSALGYVDAVEKQVMFNQIGNGIEIIPGTYTVDMLKVIGVEVKGEEPDDASTVTIDLKGGVSKAVFKFSDGYYVQYNGEEATATKTAADYDDANVTFTTVADSTVVTAK